MTKTQVSLLVGATPFIISTLLLQIKAKPVVKAVAKPTGFATEIGQSPVAKTVAKPVATRAMPMARAQSKANMWVTGQVSRVPSSIGNEGIPSSRAKKECQRKTQRAKGKGEKQC